MRLKTTNGDSRGQNLGNDRTMKIFNFNQVEIFFTRK